MTTATERTSTKQPYSHFTAGQKQTIRRRLLAWLVGVPVAIGVVVYLGLATALKVHLGQSPFLDIVTDQRIRETLDSRVGHGRVIPDGRRASTASSKRSGPKRTGSSVGSPVSSATVATAFLADVSSSRA